MTRQGKQRNAAPSVGPVTAHLHPTRCKELPARRAPDVTAGFFFPWIRVAVILQNAGFVRSNEEICSFVVEDGGVTVHMRTR